MMRAARIPAAALLTLALTSCAQPHDGDVRSAASMFYDAYAAGDGDGACDLLAPRTQGELERSAGLPCAEAILQEPVPSVSQSVDVQVFGTQAEVTWTDETTFLARFPDGWKVMAAACTPRRGHPYDCMLSGG